MARNEAGFRIGRLAAAALAVFLFVSAVPAPDGVLVRVGADGAGWISAEREAGLRVVQELRDSLLVVLPGERWAALASRGVAGEVLDTRVRDKKYFLVFTPREGDRAVLGGFGTAVPLEEGTCLFWSGATEARKILPAAFKIKRLALDRDVPWPASVEPAVEPPSGDADAASDSRIVGWVGKVAKTRLTAEILGLQNFKTRYTSTGGCQASGNYLYNRLVQMGYSCSTEPFTVSGISTRNIIARKAGKKYPGWVVIVCAHYDSTSNKPYTLAPGADDNASGTAAVLEIARVLAGASFDYTVKFVCFSAEEWGLYGSDHYAGRAKSRGEKIVGVINMDMVAYTDAVRKKLEIYVNSASNTLGTKFLQAAATYAPLPVAKVIDGSADWSDHSSFWDYGYPALCGIESAADWNPYYHRTTDTLDKLNLNFCVSVTKAALAATAVLARPYPAAVN